MTGVSNVIIQNIEITDLNPKVSSLCNIVVRRLSKDFDSTSGVVMRFTWVRLALNLHCSD